MSKSDKKASGEERGGRQRSFVLDFLYNDARRIGSFLAQFDDSGHLQRVTQHEAAAKGHRRSFKLNLSGGATVLGTGGSGGVGVERGPGEAGSESLEREYDPLWANAMTLLDFLSAEGLIKDDLSKAGIGQFVRISGGLTIHDLGTLRLLWDEPVIQNKMKEGAGQ